MVLLQKECRRSVKAAGVSKNVSICNSLCRYVCSMVESTLAKLQGTEDEPIQIDESYFLGLKKYNGGCLASGERCSAQKVSMRAELEIACRLQGRPTHSTNYNNHEVGPWFFWIYKSRHDL